MEMVTSLRSSSISRALRKYTFFITHLQKVLCVAYSNIYIYFTTLYIKRQIKIAVHSWTARGLFFFIRCTNANMFENLLWNVFRVDRNRFRHERTLQEVVLSQTYRSVFVPKIQGVEKAIGIAHDAPPWRQRTVFFPTFRTIKHELFPPIKICSAYTEST